MILLMNISPNRDLSKWQVTVQQNYNSIPRTLYDKLKNYIEDPLNKKWIINSKSFYSSPVVTARKKDGSLQHCCNYCKLN